jgi:hypothetical protein
VRLTEAVVTIDTNGVCYSEGMYNDFKQKSVGYLKMQAGKRYEKFVAETLRMEGWEVIETGQEWEFDHGIDLIASKDGVRRYVQCKGWNEDKLIHEDVVSQLFGSVAGIEGPDNLSGVEIYLYSSAQLGQYAQMECDNLHIHFVHLVLPSYPQKLQHQYRYRKHRFHQHRRKHSYR